MDIICLLEKHFDSSIQPDHEYLEIPGYNSACSYHPSNNKRGGVCLYYKVLLPLTAVNIRFLKKCITFEVMIGDKQCNYVTLYWSSSQNQDGFDSFSKNLEVTYDKVASKNPFMLAVIGNLNAK